MRSSVSTCLVGVLFLSACSTSDGSNTPTAMTDAVAAPAEKAPAEKSPAAEFQSWNGSHPDHTLESRAPQDGLITTAKAWEALRDAWQLGNDKVVDLDKNLVLVGTTRGSRIAGKPVLNAEGDLRFAPISTRDLRDGFRYLIYVVPRQGVKTVNGKPLP